MCELPKASEISTLVRRVEEGDDSRALWITILAGSCKQRCSYSSEQKFVQTALDPEDVKIGKFPENWTFKISRSNKNRTRRDFFEFIKASPALLDLASRISTEKLSPESPEHALFVEKIELFRDYAQPVIDKFCDLFERPEIFDNARVTLKVLAFLDKFFSVFDAVFRSESRIDQKRLSPRIGQFYRQNIYTNYEIIVRLNRQVTGEFCRLADLNSGCNGGILRFLTCDGEPPHFFPESAPSVAQYEPNNIQVVVLAADDAARAAGKGGGGGEGGYVRSPPTSAGVRPQSAFTGVPFGVERFATAQEAFEACFT